MTTFDVDGHKITAEIFGGSLYLRIEGCGTATEADGWPICIDWFHGEPTVYVWADIEQEGPTHTISLKGASEDESI